MLLKIKRIPKKTALPTIFAWLFLARDGRQQLSSCRQNWWGNCVANIAVSFIASKTVVLAWESTNYERTERQRLRNCVRFMTRAALSMFFQQQQQLVTVGCRRNLFFGSGSSPIHSHCLNDGNKWRFFFSSPHLTIWDWSCSMPAIVAAAAMEVNSFVL